MAGEKSDRVGAKGIFIGLGVLVIWGFVVSYVANTGVLEAITSPATCGNETLEFSSVSKFDPTIPYSASYTDGGQNGIKNVCRKNGEIVSSSIVNAAVDGTYHIGTKSIASPAPSSSQILSQSSGARTGAVCNDGSSSYATGRGACSHHGGVDYWTY